MADAFELLKRAKPFIQELFDGALHRSLLHPNAKDFRIAQEAGKWLKDYDKLHFERDNKDVIP
jgi:hypothetical protein